MSEPSFSTILIMTIIGLWHGPSVNYIFFGFLHGLGLAINTYLSNKNINFLPIENNKLRNVICWILTFSFVNITFIYFRSSSFSQANEIVFGLFSFNNFYNNDLLINYLRNSIIAKIIIISSLIIFLKNSYEIISKIKINLLNSIILALSYLFIIYIIMYNSTRVNKFIYFNF